MISMIKATILFLQGKALKEIQAILTEILAYFPPGRAKDLPVPVENSENWGVEYTCIR